MAFSFLKRYLKLESTSGIFLFVTAVVALILSNSPWALWYHHVFNTPLQLQLSTWVLTKPLSFWINECLMTLFFLLVGLELKREFLLGELREIAKIVLPAIAAAGGMLIPALIYALINWGYPDTLKGWAIPVATDIAFALGVLSLFGKRVPIGLKLFLMALAIFDDIGAIIIIAGSHTGQLSIGALAFSFMVLFLIYVFNYFKVHSLVIYSLLGLVLWFSIFASGVHPTVAGVLLALMVPVSEGQRFEMVLHPWVAFLIMPLFAFANAGIEFAGLNAESVWNRISLGILLGLFVGKQIGVFSFTWLSVKLGWAKLPERTNWFQLYGVSLLCGIGFTMSLFLGNLAFDRDNFTHLISVRLGVLAGSTLSGMIGAMILHRALRKRAQV